MYEESHKAKNAKKLPKTLDVALSKLSDNKMLKNAFSKETINSYIKLRKKEIKLFDTRKNKDKKIITDWEKINTLDC